MHSVRVVNSVSLVYLTAAGYNYFVLQISSSYLSSPRMITEYSDPRVKKIEGEIEAAENILHSLKTKLRNGGKREIRKKGDSEKGVEK